MRYQIALGVLALALTGCMNTVALKREQDERKALRQIEATRPICISDRLCEAMWSAARNWVTSTCGMKIQNITDSFIETYNDVGGNGRLACRVTKDPRPEGGYVLIITTGCSNMFGCVPDAWQAAKDFNHTVKLKSAQFAETPEETPTY